MHRGPDTFLNQVVGGRWRVLEVLGATAHGTAFRVEALADGRPARLELWDPRHVEGRGELARFEREARALSRLRHERYLGIADFGAHEGRPFLVSELPEGKTLLDELGQAELTVPRALSLGLQLCEGLAHLHRHGVAHRALLPENVWVSRSPAGELLKIGLPRIGQTADTSDATRERSYLPPERSTARPDYRADLYAAGMLLYVMCTGREPTGEVVAATAGGAPVPPPRAVSPQRGISEALQRVILRAVAPSPDVRFGTADELMAALETAGARLTLPKRRPAQRPPKRTAIVATAFAAVALLGAGALRSGGGQGPSAPPAAEAADLPSLPSLPSLPTKAPVETPPPPRVAMAAPPVAPRPVPPPAAVPARVAPVVATTTTVPAPAAPVVATSARASSHDELNEIWSLLDSGRLDEGASRIKPLVAKDPDAAWPRFALGALYYRKFFRRDAVKQWQLALAQDPEIRRDPQFAAYLCFMLDDTWKAAGVTELLAQLRGEAVPLLERCVASAKTARLRFQAARTLEGLRQADQRPRRRFITGRSASSPTR